MIRIGNARLAVGKPVGQSSPLIPRGYLSQPLVESSWWRSHVKFLMQKFMLGQDVFLLGPPGPCRRRLALSFCELMRFECELLTLSKDTTEADLKQRREIAAGGTIRYLDQPPVRAALNGRVLLLDGIEKAERNVLPTLNNLLENREMALLDGSFLTSHTRYDALLERTPSSPLHRVSEHFRVIALGLPVPPFEGHPLDPPLRSRFQARFVEADYAESKANTENDIAVNVQHLRAKASPDKPHNLRLPHLPEQIYDKIQRVRAKSLVSEMELIQRNYPFHHILSFNPNVDKIQEIRTICKGLQQTRADAEGKTVQPKWDDGFLNTVANERTVHEALLELENGHAVCLLGRKGDGKSMLSSSIAKQRQQHVRTVFCYKDMTSRDMLMKRATTDSGESKWQASEVVNAAVEGDLLVLDGVHRLDTDTLTSLSHLMFDGEIHLPDGTHLKEVHPRFGIIALAETPTSSTSAEWLKPEVIELFSFVDTPKYTSEELSRLIGDPGIIEKIQAFGISITAAVSETQSALSLSMRQLVRVAALSRFSPLDQVLYRNLLCDFLPANVQHELQPPAPPVLRPEEVERLRNALRKETLSELVPNAGEFIPLNHQLVHLHRLMQELEAGENHFLLIGNQGTGKNKITDRLLEELEWEREYMQLNRDTCINSLTTVPTLVDGVIHYVDSPLVRAIRYGRVAVLDEVDKAPLEVVCILKGLCADGEMTLSDGRRVVSAKSEVFREDDVIIDPEFKVIALANRPGYPFLGNDFFKECGDIFSCHVVANGTLEDQRHLVRALAPRLETDLVEALVKSFAELRDQCDRGIIKYPFSTRECAAIARHLNHFPEDGVRRVLDNVFDFDKLDAETMEVVSTIFERNGILLGKHHSHFVINLATPTPLQEPIEASTAVADRSHLDEPVSPEAVIEGPIKTRNVTFLLEEQEMEQELYKNMRTEGHVSEFSEQLMEFHSIGTRDHFYESKPLALCASPDGNIHVLTHSTPYLTQTSIHKASHTRVLDLDRLLGTGVGSSPTLQLFKLNGSGAVCLVAPQHGKVFRVDFDDSDATAVHYEFPSEFGGVVSRLPTRGDKVDIAGVVGDTIVLAKQDKLLHIDMNANTAKVHLLPKGVLDYGSTLSLVQTQPHLEVVIESGNGNPRRLIKAETLPATTTPGTAGVMSVKRDAGRRELKSAKWRIRAGIGENRLHVVDILRKTKAELNVRSPIVDVTWCDSDEKLALLCQDGLVRVYELDTEKLSSELDKWIDQFGLGSTGLEQELDLEFSYQPDNLSVEMIQGQQQADDDGIGIYRIPSSMASTLSPLTGGGGQGSGGGGGTGQGPSISSDGFGGYSGEKMASLLSLPLESRYEKGLPLTAEELEKLKVIDARVVEDSTVNGDLVPSNSETRYQSMKEAHRREIKQLKLVLESAEAKEQEREWLNNQVAGELDDNRLVDGVAGETHVFRKRGEPQKKIGFRQRHPKRVLFALDTSASMARGNAADRRLDRMAEAVVLVIEAMDGFEEKFDYSFIGHSGSGAPLKLLDFGSKPPKAETKRELVDKLYALALSAAQGDNTLLATEWAISNVVKEEADEYFVVVLSDANLGRYSISPREFGSLLTKDDNVKSFCIFVAEPGAAEWLQREIPLGRGVSCMKPSDLPNIFKTILTTEAGG